ncbi:unnamed protein product [Pleuronectes platessa]|uniref:Receptor ligand binding region domain-containing protein n=1 Tax=Pleuronectes platessa TaxID=8262 RepID=A0A9N7TSV8_PLEPL|nr:unnamed protein product [Pleuronectes platessa]
MLALSIINDRETVQEVAWRLLKKVCVRQEHQPGPIRLWLQLHPSPSAREVSWSVGSRLSVARPHVPAPLITQASLLNLEQLLRRFLISKETLSVRMLDESQDPTPLLKEIRDDKTATIIVDANATMSHIILERASELGMLSVYYTYIFTSLVRKWAMLWAFRGNIDFHTYRGTSVL